MGTSSLLQVAWLQQSFFPGPESSESVGVVTFKKSALVSHDESEIDSSRCSPEADSNVQQTPKHLTSVGAHPETPVYGVPEHPEAIFKSVLQERITCEQSHKPPRHLKVYVQFSRVGTNMFF